MAEPARAPMRVHAALAGRPVAQLPSAAARLERDGFDGAWMLEASNDPFVGLAATAATTTGELATAVAIAFARNPLTVAASAWDLQELSGGRLLLGLGTQIRPHIERRYGMPWSRPAARLREFVLAVRAIWASWRTGEPLDFAGEFYTHTLMPPAFRPPPPTVPPPPILLGGVGPRTVAVAGEVADGFLAHTLTSPAYLKQRLLPALTAAATAAGRPVPELSGLLLVATGRDEHELARATATVRRELAFYASTPAYRPVLDLHGWGALHEAAHALTRQGRWDGLPDLIDDEVLHTFAVVAPPDRVARVVTERFGHRYRRVLLYTHLVDDPALWAEVARGFHDRR